ncbi:phosphotransferase enzyme family protein [Ramlibacter sp.]|uniref:phosphotransferase enzyme family protein n=1 Tax=Ramlibacter sp. TaxID=1917967 RepID=UPI003D09FA5B
MIAQTTPTGEAIARAVRDGFEVGDIARCALLRRGFNHVYGLEFEDGRRLVARLSAHRPRGEPNVEYEAALLAHLKRAGVGVAASLPARDGSAALSMALPEGPRPLMLFEHLEGDPPADSLPDIEATGRCLAEMHDAAASYDGPPSRYRLELPFLLDNPVRLLHTAPTMDDALRADYAAAAQRLSERIAALPGLERVHCHGDCHGSNNFMTDGPGGRRIASFFDFDDAGPGFLAFELAVYLWAMHPRKPGKLLEGDELDRWRAYLKGYRSVRKLEDADFEAIALFVSVRQLWLFGEYAGRLDVWGTQSIPTAWLRKQVELLGAWLDLRTPAGPADGCRTMLA